MIGVQAAILHLQVVGLHFVLEHIWPQSIVHLGTNEVQADDLKQNTHPEALEALQGLEEAEAHHQSPHSECGHA